MRTYAAVLATVLPMFVVQHFGGRDAVSWYALGSLVGVLVTMALSLSILRGPR